MACNDRNPLTREGTSQQNRVLAALGAHYADVDERSAPDLILFARRYAEYLNYYNSDNVKDGDWQPFMMMDISVTLATLSSLDMRRMGDYKKLLYKNISVAGSLNEPGKTTTAELQFKYLFDAVFSLVKIVDEQFKLLTDDDYRKIIGDLVTKKLSLHVANLQERIFDVCKTGGLLDYTIDQLDSSGPFDTKTDGNFQRADLSTIWQAAPADLNITIPALPTDYEKILYLINHNLVNGTIDGILKGIATITNRAADLFEKTLVDFPRHTPHYALFLAFTKLFKIVQDDLNRFTQRHLDYYYKDVLQLVNKAAQPDHAHLTFELQKPVNQLLLKEDILFKGGKDVTGKEINYRLTNDVVLNKTTVAKIQAQQTEIASKQFVRAFPFANSEDGLGAKLLSPDKSWQTFGDPGKGTTQGYGFAIASNLFYLNEGTRTITVTAFFDAKIAKQPDAVFSCFEASLTGKKEMLKKNVTATYTSSQKKMVFEIGLVPNDPAIIPYSEKIHQLNFESDVPVLIIYLNQDTPGALSYHTLGKQRLTQINIDVEVDGVRDLVLSSDHGTIDASRPFKPFGDFPAANASFYIGSKEVFQKKISEVTLNFAEASPFSSAAYYLDEAEWKSMPNIVSKKISSINIEPAFMDFSPNESLRATSLNGFIKLGNKTDLSIDHYLTRVKTALDGTKLDLVDESKPLQYELTFGKTPAPEEIKISNFSIDYKAIATISFTTQQPKTNNHVFFHASPFGIAPVLNDGTFSDDGEEKKERFTLLEDIVSDGALFIGLQNAASDSVVIILFQVADGSSNPLKDVEPVSWFYLKNNKWFAFEDRNIVDGTGNLTESGIVTLTLPPGISNQNILFEKGLYWIKASVAKNVDAVCRMILIQAQAAEVELVQDGNNRIEFRQTLPANTISKLVVSNSGVKSITQPFDSFGGKPAESDDHFYVRVSERLRHKQRAIGIWDYEHILLEEFPELYKVKCLNHSGFYKENDKDIFCENFPGHVTIIPLPDLKNNTHVNILRPYTPVRLINNIDQYLRKLISPFVKLHVKNPQFEEIQLDFEVSFYENLDTGFYLQLLNDEIERFLCPWAFSTGVEISFGSKILKSVFINFVEERPYVDYVTCFQMHHLLRDGETVVFEKRDVEEAVATTSRSILVSYFDAKAGTKHLIKSPATCDC